MIDKEQRLETKRTCYFHGQDNTKCLQQVSLKRWYVLPTRLGVVNPRRQKLYHMASIPGDNGLHGLLLFMH